MKRNLLLLLAVIASIVLAVNSTRKLFTFHTNSQSVGQAQAQLDQLKKENAALKQELDYKKSDQFAEGEIRNKLGLTKPGESVVMVPKQPDERLTINDERLTKDPNWKKWWNIFFGV